MPELIVPIAMLATSAFTIGQGIYQDVNRPNPPNPNAGQPSPADVTKQAVAQETANRGTATKEAAQFLPGIEANSPGVSPDYLKDVSATFSGNANLAQSPEMQQLIAKFLGIDTGASFGGEQPFGSSTSSPLTPGLAG